MLVVLNHKSNLTYEEINKYEKQIRKMRVIILPTLCYLPIFKKGKYILGAQDISEFNEKSRTGEINGNQLASMKIKYCLIGHSERRIYNKESDKQLLTKINNCLINNITPLYCIGERINDNKNDIIYNQIDLVLKEYKDKEIIFIYEPINNIGKTTPDLRDIENTMKDIKEYIQDKYNKKIQLLYGGGVNVSNIDIIKNNKYIDGIILSTDSLNIKHLKCIYKKIINP